MGKDDSFSDPTQNGGFISQLAGLTKTVSSHDETLNALKGLPALVQTLVDSISSGQGDNTRHTDDIESISSHSQENNEPDLDFEALMATVTSERDNVNVDDGALSNELAEALKDIEQTSELGSSVSGNIAEAFNRTVQRPLSKETLSEMYKKQLIPENCKPLQVPKMNTEIWNNLKTRARLTDINLQSLQRLLSYGIASLAVSSEELIKIKGISPNELKLLLKRNMDIANVLGHGFQTLNVKRKSEIRPLLHQDFAGICASSTPVTEYLFGDDIKETLKISKTASTVVKQSFFRGNRVQPYDRRPQHRPRFPTQFSLNRQHPSPTYQKRGGGYNNNYNQNRPQFPSPSSTFNHQRRQ